MTKEQENVLETISEDYFQVTLPFATFKGLFSIPKYLIKDVTTCLALCLVGGEGAVRMNIGERFNYAEYRALSKALPKVKSVCESVQKDLEPVMGGDIDSQSAEDNFFALVRASRSGILCHSLFILIL